MISLDNYFKIYPKVIRANTKATITLKPRLTHWNIPEGEYKFSRYSVNYNSNKENRNIKVRREGNNFYIEGFFEGEQEHVIYIDMGNKSYSFSVYSVNDDLLSRVPYKGDMHIHTYYSDGIESPAYWILCGSRSYTRKRK